jgi:hypothetical protein
MATVTPRATGWAREWYSPTATATAMRYRWAWVLPKEMCWMRMKGAVLPKTEMTCRRRLPRK